MKKLLAISSLVFVWLMLANVSFAADKAEKISGWVSDSKCGAKGASASHADCAKKCASEGASLVIVNDKDKSIVAVDNQEALKGHEGHHVRVTGSMNGDSLHVDKVQMLKQPKAATQMGEHGL